MHNIDTKSRVGNRPSDGAQTNVLDTSVTPPTPYDPDIRWVAPGTFALSVRLTREILLGKLKPVEKGPRLAPFFEHPPVTRR